MKLVVLFFAYLCLDCIAKVSGQSSCGGFEYYLDLEKDIPRGFEFLKSYRADDKGGLIKVELTLVGAISDTMHIELRNPCAENNLSVSIWTAKRELVAKTQNEESQLTFTFPKNGIYYLGFTISENTCRSCGVAILSKKK
jgi:hypothetical protein